MSEKGGTVYVKKPDDLLVNLSVIDVVVTSLARDEYEINMKLEIVHEKTALPIENISLKLKATPEELRKIIEDRKKKLDDKITEAKSKIQNLLNSVIALDKNFASRGVRLNLRDMVTELQAVLQ